MRPAFPEPGRITDMHARPIHYQKGISLIEALIAALILAVAVLAITGLQVNTLNDSGQSRVSTHALNFAEEKIEELRDFSRFDVYSAFANGSDTQVSSNATLSRSWSISACPNSATCKQAQVTVTWSDTTGTQQQVVLTSYISEEDPVRGGAALLEF